MKKINFYMKLLIASILMSLTIKLSAQEKINFSDSSWSVILTQAKQQQKIIYIDCHTSWCSPCRKMEQDIFTAPNVIDFYNDNFICMHLDMEKGIGPKIAELYKVNVYPTHLFLDSNGNVVHRASSYKTIKEFIELGKEALNPEKQSTQLEVSYKQGNRNKKFLFEYMLYLKSIKQDYNIVLDEYLQHISKEEIIKEENLRILYEYTTNINSKAFDLFYQHLDLIKKLYKEKYWKLKYFNILFSSMIIAAKTQDEKSLNLIVALYEKDIFYKEDRKMIYTMFYIPYYKKTEDYHKMGEVIDDYIEEFISTEKEFKSLSKNELEDKAKLSGNTKEWWYYDSAPKMVRHKFNSMAKDLAGFAQDIYKMRGSDSLLEQKAMMYLQKAILIEEKFEYYELLTKWYYRVDSRKLTKEHIEKTLALAKKEKYKTEDYEELLKIIKTLTIKVSP